MPPQPATSGRGQVQAATAAGGIPAQQQQGGGFGQSLSGIIRIAILWYFASKFFSPKPPPSTTGVPPVFISNLFRKGEPLVSSTASSFVHSYMYVCDRIKL